MENRFGTNGGEFDKAAMAARLRSIREEIYGEDGGPEIAQQLGLPLRTWLNYERGVTIPGEVVLHFLILTGAEPLWVLVGRGMKYRVLSPEPSKDWSWRE